MIQTSFRLSIIVLGSLVLGAGYIELFKPKLDWVPSRDQLMVEQDVRSDHAQARGTIDAILARAGIGSERLLELVKNGALVVDGRSAAEFSLGHLDAPYIANLTPDEFATQGYLFEQLLISHPPVPIVLYCYSSSCDDSKTSYATLQRIYAGLPGLGEVYIYVEGWAGILAEGLRVAMGEGRPFATVISDLLIQQQLGQAGAIDPAAGPRPRGQADG